MKAMEANLLSIDVIDFDPELRNRGHHGPLPGRGVRGMRVGHLRSGWAQACASKVYSRPSLTHRQFKSCLVTHVCCVR